jgi:ribosomal protein S18 acetylase RimI-like enzyme
VQIRRMSLEDMDSACEVLGMAFADNPNTLAVTGGDRSKARRMIQTVVRTAKLGRKFSHVLVAEDAGRIVGVLNAAQWPNCQLGIGEQLRTAPAMIRVVGWGLPKSMTMLSIWAKHDPQEPHWHLGPIGVHPDSQGRGVGQTLLGSFLKTLDEQRLPAYLETDVDRNVVLYEKFGFKVIAQADINGVNNRFMWRAASA